MPYSASHKLRTRQRILESARRRFNSRGFADVTIEEVMRHAGLSHGGFYRHFRDKDQLFVEAVRWFLCEEAPKPWQGQRRRSRKSQAARIVDAYFSLDHFGDRESCCPLVGLPMANAGDDVRGAYQDVLAQLLRLLEAGLAGPGARERALSLAALAVGGMVLARTVVDPELARDLRLAAYRRAQTVLNQPTC
jgi:AcrR family transcriptional regulator